MELTQREAATLLQFLQRVDLKGAEAPIFVNLVVKLQQIAESAPAPGPATVSDEK